MHTAEANDCIMRFVAGSTYTHKLASTNARTHAREPRGKQECARDAGGTGGGGWRDRTVRIAERDKGIWKKNQPPPPPTTDFNIT